MNELVFGPPSEWPDEDSQYQQVVAAYLRATRERERYTRTAELVPAITLTNCHSCMR